MFVPIAPSNTSTRVASSRKYGESLRWPNPRETV
jgi:hypothetical protein